MVNWRRLYWCTRDGWTGEWYQRHGWSSDELSLWRLAKVGVGWRGPMYDMRTSDVRDLLRGPI